MKPFLFIVALILSTLSSLLGQQAAASLQGTVADPSGAVVPNATLALTGPATHSTRSDGQGRWTFTGLPAGAYTLHASGAGFSDWEQQGVALAAGQAKSLNIVLALRTESQQVTVTSERAPALDTDPTANADALVLTKTDLDALPDDPDDLTADLQALAGPSAGPNGGQIYIDGFTGGRLPPKQSIREIRINQNPFAAQFDRPGQGRVEIFTKPGSEEFHGDVLFQFSDAALNSRNPFVTSKPPYQRRQWEGEISGALGKKTSFFADFERRDINENALVNAFVLDSNFHTQPFTQAVVTPLTGIEANFKIERQLSTNHTLTVSYGYARDTNDNAGVGGFSLPTRAYRQETDEHTIQAIETAILNQHMVNEARFRFRKQDTDQSGGANTPVISVLDAFNSGGSSIGNSFNRQNRYELQNYTSYISGAHTVRWGGLLRAVNLNDQSMQNYAGTFTFTSLQSYALTLAGVQAGQTPAQIRAAGGGASQFSLTAGDPLASVNQFDWGFFAQDDWKLLSNLTLSAGLRYEGQTHVRDGKDLGPRLGLAWAPKSKQGVSKNVIRAGFGMFYDRLSESLTLDALRQNGIRQQAYLIQNPDFYPSIPTPASLAAGAQTQTVRETDSYWRNPTLVQASLGIERQLPRHMTLASNYIHSIGIHQLRSRDINAPLPGSGATPYGGLNAIYLYETSGVYRQDQWMTSLTARVSPKLTFNGSYVYGNARSNTDGPGTLPANEYDLSREYGRAGFDIRHRLQFNGSWTTRWNLRFSPFLTVTSGRPYNITTGIDENGDGLFTDRPALLPRNSGNGPGMVATNLRFSKIINLGDSKGKDDPKQLVLSVNARNILNHPNFAPPDGNLSSPLFGISTALLNGNGSSGNRRLDLQLRFNF